MSIMLKDLQACFEGVVPAIIATADAEGIPNISYLSQVVAVDDNHVALSNQFFAKTAANVRANPNALLIVVDGRTGEQFRLEVRFIRTLDSGPIYDRVARQLHASSAQAGIADVMQLRAVDIYSVLTVSAVASPAEIRPPPARNVPTLAVVAKCIQRIAESTGVDRIIDAALDCLYGPLRFDSVLLLVPDRQRSIMVTIGSKGYSHSGIGSEIAIGDGVIGVAARDQTTVKISDMTRVRRFGDAIQASGDNENRTRTILLPSWADAISQIAVPMIAHDMLQGVIFAESRKSLAFDSEDEAVLSLIANQTASALALEEALSKEQQQAPDSAANPADSGKAIQITHHAFDDSVFVNDEYVIKGVPGRLLMFLLETYQREGRVDFTNREIRLARALKLPDIKDNLETRLLLLRRRLDDKELPLGVERVGRGRIRLRISGTPVIHRIA